MIFSDKILYWYSKNKRELPWRETKDPYLVWLSEIMLQQTRVAQGLSYFLTFKEEFPTIDYLAKADETTVLKLWQGLGYYSRARNLHATAKYISQEQNGIFPNTYAELIKLKGVGDYTASAIASICFNESKAVVDGNVYRVLARYFGVQTPINSSKGVKEFKQLAQSLIPKNNPGAYNQALMDFGSLQCKPQNPNCSACPLADSCIALVKDAIKQLPSKEKKVKIKNRYFHYLIFKTDDGKTILEQRTQKGIWQGLYQFPLVELPKANSAVLSSKEFKELVSTKAKVSLLNHQPILHKLSHQHLHTWFWLVKVKHHPKALIEYPDFYNYPVPVLLSKFIAQNTSILNF